MLGIPLVSFRIVLQRARQKKEASLVDDYFVTYSNYYGIEKGSEKYNVIKEIHIDEMICYVFRFDHGVSLLGTGYYSKARAYLEDIGLSETQIDALQEKFSE